MKFIFIILSILFAIGCSIGAGHREIITYHKLTKEQKKVLGRIVKEKYEVRKGTKIKNGKYERYDLNFLRLEQGNYVNGQKTGVWKIWNEEDEIWIERDIDQNGKENPIINQEYLKYPMIIVEERDSLPTGRIVMKLKFDDNCQLEQLELINGIDNEFDSIIVNKYKRYARLSKKYQIPIEDCTLKRDTLKILYSN
ncbi:MAG: hypothetical protein IPH98_19295 [Saprospiraceae bacterium]|nr:hypothetical protein [Candidatus Defluviibacterium haderslevense]